MVNLLIVESPGKVKTLKKILGAGWDVRPSVGHICQLAQDGPEKLGFDMTETEITCRYEPNGERGADVIAQLQAAVKRASRVLLAPDPDREGEAIAWHLARELGIPIAKAERVTYTQITEQAVKAAVAKPRKINLALVNAQRARQVLDRLVGWKASPIVWRVGGKSAGRVQSAALHLVCTREEQIKAFMPVPYWSVWVDYATPFRAFYQGTSSVEVEEEEDDAKDGNTTAAVESSRVLSETEAQHLVAVARPEVHRVVKVENQTTTKAPPPPFTTSSLQQAASAQIGLNPERCMAVAQKLYEGMDVGQGPTGLITYMRTDSISLSPEFIQEAQAYLKKHDPDNIPAKTAKHKSKDGAQEAHEAIRPTHLELKPEDIKAHLTHDEYRLYDLIWRRALASQCAPAKLNKTKITTQSGPITWVARGMTVAAAGYTRYWPNLDAGLVLPVVTEGQELRLANAGSDSKTTQPPSRFTEAKLVQIMERLGIGRPSTFAPTVATIRERGYVELKGKALIATPLGLQVDVVLGQTLPDLIAAPFTAGMEESLDKIACDQEQWERWLIGWNRSYLAPALAKAYSTPGLLPPPARQAQGELKLSKQLCPSCQQPMAEIPGDKAKHPKGHFLKCQSCENSVMFWSAWTNAWEAPKPKPTGPQAPQPPAELTEFPCPVCNKKKRKKKPVCLEKFTYTKEEQQKILLRCSDQAARQKPDHKEVAFFWSRERWWSKEFGELQAQE